VLDWEHLESKKKFDFPWGDPSQSTATLRAKGHLRSLAGDGVDRNFVILPTTKRLVADGATPPASFLRVTDQFGNVRPYANDPLSFQLEGPVS